MRASGAAPGTGSTRSRAPAPGTFPTAGEEDEGQWWLHFTDGRLGPWPSQQAAWDGWHASLRQEPPGIRTETLA